MKARAVSSLSHLCSPRSGMLEEASCFFVESEGERKGRRRQGNLKDGPEGTLGSFFVRRLNI